MTPTNSCSNVTIGHRYLKFTLFGLIMLTPLKVLSGNSIAELLDPNKDLTSTIVNVIDGEQLNLRTGRLGYYSEDFNIEGKGPTIRLGRSYSQDRQWQEFSDMMLDVPRIEYTTVKSYINYLDHHQTGTAWGVIDSVDAGICQGLKQLNIGSYLYAQGDVQDEGWVHSKTDLASGIRFQINGKSINLYTKEHYIAGSRFPNEALYVSPDNWFATCDGPTWVVHSPDGKVYRLGTYEFRYKDTFVGVTFNKGNQVSVFLDSVTDKYNNQLLYQYHTGSRLEFAVDPIDGPEVAVRKQYLDSITANDGRELNITYDTSNSLGRISSIYDNSSNQRRLDYSYNGASLYRVTRRDGSYWQYQYSRVFTGTESHFTRDLSMTVQTPKGMVINYSFLPSVQNIYPLASRTITGPGLPGAMVWNYSYHGLSGDRKATFIRGPSSSEQHIFRIDKSERGAGSVPLLSLFAADAGQLLESSIFPTGSTYGANNPLKHIDYTWIQRPGLIDLTAAAGYSSARGLTIQPTGRLAHYFVSMKRVPSMVTTTIDGQTFTKSYSNYDVYDNPQTLTETGNAGSRTTNYTYHNDDTNWIVSRLKNETIVGGGPGIVRTFNIKGNLTTEQQNGLSVKTYTYNPTGHVAAGELNQISWLRDGLQLSQQFQDYYRGIARTEVNPDGETTFRMVSDDGTVSTMTDPNGKVTTYTYDNLHRIDIASSPLYASSDTNWSNSNRTRTTTQGNQQVTENFDALGRTINATQVDLTDSTTNTQTVTTYDTAGRVAFQSLPKTTTGASIGFQYTYDALNRVKMLTHTGDNSVSTYCYQIGNCSFATGKLTLGYAMTDARGFHTIHNFEAYGDPDDRRLLNIHDTTGATPASAIDRLTSIGRNIYGDITSIGRGSTVRTYGYSSTTPRQIQTVTEPETGVTTYTYRSDGSLKTTKTGASAATQYAHDNSGRVININYPGITPDVTNTYYPNGELKTSATDGTLWNYILNAENDLSQEALGIDSLTLATHYTYDNLGNTETIQYPSGRTITQGNDALGRTRSINTYINSAGYYPNGQLSSITFGNGQVTTITQSNKHYPEQLKTARNGNTLVDMTYAYDKNNNIKTIFNPVLGNKTLGYDGVNRLISAAGPWGTGNTIHAGSISYDHNDNITQKTMGTHSLGYVYDSSNKLTNTTGSKVYAFGYDNYGNVSSNGTDTFIYNDANQLKTIGANSYRYDVHNRRVKASKAGIDQYYVYTSNGRLMHRYNAQSQQTTDYIYLAGKQIAKHDQKPDPLQVTTAPVFSPAGGSSIGTVTVIMSATPVSANPSIRYTTNGSTPTISSTAYTGPLVFTSNTTLKAKVIGTGFVNSPETSSTFTVAAAAPSISPNGGTYLDRTLITLSSSTSGSSIYYTTNGSAPTTGSTQYTGPFNLTTNGAIMKAIAIAPGKANSVITTSSSFTITPTAIPAISPNGGSFYDSASVSLSSSTPGASIYYTTNGAAPNTSSARYTSTFNLGIGNYTVRAFTYAGAGHISGTQSASFSIIPTPTAATPTMTSTRLAGSTTVYLSSTPGVTIHFTDNLPTYNHQGVITSYRVNALYGSGITYTNTTCHTFYMQLTAVASGANYITSPVASFTIPVSGRGYSCGGGGGGGK